MSAEIIRAPLVYAGAIILSVQMRCTVIDKFTTQLEAEKVISIDVDKIK